MRFPAGSCWRCAPPPPPLPSVNASSVEILSAPALSTPTAVARTCSAHAFPAGTPGVVTRRAVVPAAGFLDARLNGSPTGAGLGSRDLRRRQRAAAGRLGRVRRQRGRPGAGRRRPALTSRRAATAAAPRRSGCTSSDIVVSGTLPKAPKLTSGLDPVRQRRAARPLGAAGASTSTRPRTAIASTRSSPGPADEAILRDAGMSYRVKHADLVAYDRKILARRSR